MRKYQFVFWACLSAAALVFGGCGNDGVVTVNNNTDKPSKEQKEKPGKTVDDEDDDGNGDGKKDDGNDDGKKDDGNDDGKKDDGNGEGKEDKPVVTPETSDCNAPDADGDTISDEIEGTEDHDGDGIPDYQDDDSDGDGIPDKVEAGTNGCSGNEPVDTDDDDLPDYLDDDSDDNMIPDKDEAGPDPLHPVDTDGDTLPDYMDMDNDGDGIDDYTEIFGEAIFGKDVPEGYFSGQCEVVGAYSEMGSETNPVDCDHDGTPDYMDEDSDGDGIPDKAEGSTIIGNYYARYSKDSDGNGVSDADECGMTGAVNSMLDCVDTDGNGIPDVFDIDNDGDGLSDIDEVNKYHTDMNKLDSDGDGVEDFVEIAIGTAPDDATKNPQANGDFVFVVPYKKESSPKKQSLSFATSVQTLDIYFAIDQSGSMDDEISTLQRKIPSMIETMRCKDLGRGCEDNKDCADLNGGLAICSEQKKCIVSPDTGCFDNMWTGVGWWGNIDRFRNGSSLNADPQATARALSSVPSLGSSENCIQPGACVVKGAEACNNSSKYPLNCAPVSDATVGCVGYRKDAIKILIQAGDEANSDSGNYTVANAGLTGQMLKDAKVRFIGLWGSTAARDRGVKQLACEAGSCVAGENCAADCQSMSDSERDNLFMAQINNSDIEQNTINMVHTLAKNMMLHVTSGVDDIDLDASKLVDKLVVNITDTEVQGRPCTVVSGVSGDKFQEIAKLRPGTSVCYDVIPVENQEIFEPKSEPQLLKAKVKVMGDGSVLNSGIAYFVVPPVVTQEEEVRIN